MGRLAGRLLSWLDRLQIWLVVAVFVLLGVSLIDPVRKVLERYVTLDADFYAWVVAGMFVVTLAILRQLETVVTQILSKVSVEPQAPALVANVSDVLRDIELAMRRVQSPEHRNLTVIGLTMLYAGPVLQRWLRTEDTAVLRGWRIRVYMLSAEFLRRDDYFDPSWAQTADTYASQIRALITDAADNGVDLSLVSYPLRPALHGFLLGNGDLFISFCWWDVKQGVVSQPQHFYDHFGPEDLSERAQQYRALFRNSIQHFERVGEQLLPLAGTDPSRSSPVREPAVRPDGVENS
jgi:hypothetical protein